MKTDRGRHPDDDSEPWLDIEEAGNIYGFAAKYYLDVPDHHFMAYPAQAYGFRDVVLPRLARLIRAQLAAEAA